LSIEDFSHDIITFLTTYNKAQLGAIYLVNEERTHLQLVGSYAISNPKEIIKTGEGLIGEYAREIIVKCDRKKHKAKSRFIQNLPENFLAIFSASGSSFAQNLLQIPFQFENELVGILEMAGLTDDETLTEKLELADLIVFSLGIGFHSQLNSSKVRSLLIETQQQKEEIEAQHDALETERQKVDNLLLNILPIQVAQELKETQHATPQYYEKASVLFTDFQGFTRIASSLTPAEVIAELDYCFLAFDEITEKYGLEKIKTIGDSYMCAGGLPAPNDTNPEDAVLAALEIMQFMNNWQKTRIAEGREIWHIRIGIHTGELVAGVVGKKKFAYDIWGDAVNIASRMESNSETDKINISSATYECIKEKFDCTFRGSLPIKNGGEVPMYFVNASKTIDESTIAKLSY
jgi:class 3 adenylate cyclase